MILQNLKYLDISRNLGPVEFMLCGTTIFCLGSQEELVV